MPHTRVKICGITNGADAHSVVTAGADALGLVFYPDSPRAVTVVQAAEIAAEVPPFVTLVGLFVNESQIAIDDILQQVPLDMIQFHGDESAAFCSQFQRPWIKALRVRPGTDVAEACHEFAAARGILLDSWQEGLPGGTGRTFDWQLAAGKQSLPLILAGGLNPENVGSAIEQLHPAAVDVSGGVEISPGRKDAVLIERFVAEVRLADETINGTAA